MTTTITMPNRMHSLRCATSVPGIGIRPRLDAGAGLAAMVSNFVIVNRELTEPIVAPPL